MYNMYNLTHMQDMNRYNQHSDHMIKIVIYSCINIKKQITTSNTTEKPFFLFWNKTTGIKEEL